MLRNEVAKARIVILGWSDSVHIQRWVTGLSQRDYAVRLISPGGDPIDGIDTVILPRAGKLDYLLQMSQVRRHIQDFNPDLVHAHYASSLGLWADRSGFKPNVVSVWGSDVTVFGKSWWGKMVLRRVVGRATAVTATSEFLKSEINRLIPDISAAVEVIPFGVDVPPSCPSLPPGAIVNICFLKSHRMIYGPDILMKAFAKARAKMPSLRLNLAGRGSMTEDLQALANSLGIVDAVSFVGWLDRSQIYPFLQTQHLLAMPSRMESFGVAALEAAACGRPVVATSVGGVHEVVRDGVTGFLVPPDDPEALAESILKVAGDRVLMQRLGSHGYAMARDNFAWSRSLDVMAQLYDRLINEAKKHPSL